MQASPRRTDRMCDARREYLDRLTMAGYASRFMLDGAPCAVTGQGNAPEPDFLLSIPKAGTYLAAGVARRRRLRRSRLADMVG